MSLSSYIKSFTKIHWSDWAMFFMALFCALISIFPPNGKSSSEYQKEQVEKSEVLIDCQPSLTNETDSLSKPSVLVE